jgi:hypothetical protein
MINLFGKKKLIIEKDYDFLAKVVESLPAKYSYLIQQVSKEFILEKKINPLGDKGTYTLTLNADLETKYSNKSFPQLFIIKDIGVWNNVLKSYELVELHILEGMLAGFRVNADYMEFDLNRIDISRIKEKHFRNKDKEFLKTLIGHVSKDVFDQLDIESTFIIEYQGSKFYVIKDLKDGNYLSMDETGAVYAMIHDPFEIKMLFDSKDVFYKAIESGAFNIFGYIENKLS